VRRAAGRSAERRVQRDQILRVATEEFGTRGYRSTNLRDVATRLGVTRQALYHYFPHKHDILVTLFMDYFDELEGNLRAATQGAAAADSFREMMRAHIALMAARPWISSVFEREEGQIPRRAASVVRERRRALHQLFVDAYNEGVRAGSLRKADAKLVVSIVLGVAGWLHRWYKIDGKLKPDSFGQYAEELLFDGVGVGKRSS
jgi:AcrR family transcriptional regulator